MTFSLRDGFRLTCPRSDHHRPVLYTHLCCPYAQRSLLCFLEKVWWNLQLLVRYAPKSTASHLCWQSQQYTHCILLQGTVHNAQMYSYKAVISKKPQLALSSDHPGLQGAEFELVHIDLAKKPAWYARINVHELVPAVSYQGRNITESIDICK